MVWLSAALPGQSRANSSSFPHFSQPGPSVPPSAQALQSQLVSVLDLDPFGSEMTKPALLVLVPCPWQCQSWNRGLYFLISCRRRALSMLASARASFMVWSSLCSSGTCLSCRRQAENKAGVLKDHSELLQGKPKQELWGSITQ